MYAVIALFILAWSGSYPRHARDITVDLPREIHGLTTLCSATGERVPVKCCRFIPDSPPHCYALRIPRRTMRSMPLWVCILMRHAHMLAVQ